jgi:hypothetical protein
LEITERLLGTASQELRREHIGQAAVYFGHRQSGFRVGETTVRVGLSEVALKLIQSLQQPQQLADERLLQSFEREIASTGRLLRPYENIFLRNDGVIGTSVA